MNERSSGKKRPRPFEAQPPASSDDGEENDRIDMQISSDSEMESTVDEAMEPFREKVGQLDEEMSIYSLISGTLHTGGETPEAGDEHSLGSTSEAQPEAQAPSLAEELKEYTTLMHMLLKEQRLAPFGVARGLAKWPQPLEKFLKEFPEYRISDPAICELSDGLHSHQGEHVHTETGAHGRPHAQTPLLCQTHPPPELLRAFRRVFSRLRSQLPSSLPEEPAPEVVARICKSTAKAMELLLYGFFRRMAPSYYDLKVRNRRTPLSECKTILSLCKQLNIPDAVLDRAEARMGELCKAFCKQRSAGVLREVQKRDYPLRSNSPFDRKLLVGDDMTSYLAAFPRVFAFFPYQAEPLRSMPVHWCDSCQTQLIGTLLNSSKVLETALCGPNIEENMKSELIERSHLMIPMSRKAFRASLGQMKFSKPSYADAYFQSRLPSCLFNIFPVAIASFFRDTKIFAINFFTTHRNNIALKSKKRRKDENDSCARESAAADGKEVKRNNDTSEECDTDNNLCDSRDEQAHEEVVQQGVLALEMAEACAKYMPYKNLPRATSTYQEKRRKVESMMPKGESNTHSNSQSRSTEETATERPDIAESSASKESLDDSASIASKEKHVSAQHTSRGKSNPGRANRDSTDKNSESSTQNKDATSERGNQSASDTDASGGEGDLMTVRKDLASREKGSLEKAEGPSSSGKSTVDGDKNPSYKKDSLSNDASSANETDSSEETTSSKGVDEEPSSVPSVSQEEHSS